ncbi:LytR family transcriptional attenuator [Streptomyces sp. SLBN-118]|uniref:LCP family protein n=1 Tax=Streptomyces sp. SLBN-118 TaxID=2768454 RepID=UPI0011714823|nr:LCP family protein [Streptomyces sp. SLBN-118]TQK42907.1 LytR family transcriptional attenuator [Streptomyces sp. SLBN-118]
MRSFALSAVLVVTLASGGSLWTADQVASQPSRADESKGTNVLVVGIDRRAGMSAEEIKRLHVGGKGCDCTDVMMLVHIAEDGGRMTAVSIPRDSYVEFADHAHPRHSGKINAAFAHGGGDLTVRTVEKVTGLKIDHYLETDFTGFVNAVDRLGGAKVCTDKPLVDLGSGLNLPVGTSVLDGRRALRYVRARHLSPPGDLGRVRRQQRLLIDMLSRLREEGAFASATATARTALALHEFVRTDGDTSLADLAHLGSMLGRLNANQTEFATVPISDFDFRTPHWGSALLWDTERSAALWELLREDRSILDDTRIRPSKDVPVEIPPEWIHVRVTDPEVADALQAGGFVIEGGSGQAGAPRPEGPTVITYDPYWERYAATVKAAIPGAELRPVAGHGSVFDVAVGSKAASVVKVVYDRSSVEGAPVTGDRLRCGITE